MLQRFITDDPTNLTVDCWIHLDNDLKTLLASGQRSGHQQRG